MSKALKLVAKIEASKLMLAELIENIGELVEINKDDIDSYDIVVDGSNNINIKASEIIDVEVIHNEFTEVIKRLVEHVNKQKKIFETELKTLNNST